MSEKLATAPGISQCDILLAEFQEDQKLQRVTGLTQELSGNRSVSVGIGSGCGSVILMFTNGAIRSEMSLSTEAADALVDLIWKVVHPGSSQININYVLAAEPSK